MDGNNIETHYDSGDVGGTLSSPKPEPIQFTLDSGARAIVYPAGVQIGLADYKKFLAPKHLERHTIDPMEIWKTAVDKDGIVWLGANVRKHEDVWSAIRLRGHQGVDDDSVRLQIYIDRRDMVYKIGIPFSITYLTEEAAYRVLEILPKARILDEVRIIGSGCSKVLGKDEVTRLEYRDVNDAVTNPNYIRMENTPHGLMVTYRLPGYPQELKADQRLKFGNKNNLWLWYQAIQKKYNLQQRKP